MVESIKEFRKVSLGEDNAYILVNGSAYANVDQHDAVEEIRILDNIKSNTTSLISVYIPSNRPKEDVIQQLRNEAGTALNIKDIHTRNNVQNALVGIIKYLQNTGISSSGGTIIFCGVVSDYDVQIPILYAAHAVNSNPVDISLYRCDNRFWTHHLKNIAVGIHMYRYRDSSVTTTTTT